MNIRQTISERRRLGRVATLLLTVTAVVASAAPASANASGHAAASFGCAPPPPPDMSTTPGWSADSQHAVGSLSPDRPAGVGFNGRLYSIWRNPDSSMSYTVNTGAGAPFPGGTSNGPAATVFNNAIYVAWKGIPGDNRMFLTSSASGSSWPGEHQIPGGTSSSPALAAYNGRLYMAWKGIPDDYRLFVASTADGYNWTPALPIPYGNSSDGPALAAYNGRLYMVWKGVPGDSRMWEASLGTDGVWTSIFPISGLTQSAPALQAFPGGLYRAWMGAPGDVHLWTSVSANGTSWPPETWMTGSTSEGPTLAATPNYLYLLWHGIVGDDRMFISYGPNRTNAELTVTLGKCQTGSYVTLAGARFTPNNTVSVYRSNVYGQPPNLLWRTLDTDAGGGFVDSTVFCDYDPNQRTGQTVYAIDNATNTHIDRLGSIIC